MFGKSALCDSQPMSFDRLSKCQHDIEKQNEC